MEKEPTNIFNRLDLLFLSIILLIGLVLRLYKITTPLADFHSWRQADTAAVARNFVNDSFNVLSPRFDDLSNIASGTENPNGYRFVEFPLYNATFAALYKVFPAFPVEVYGRLVSAIFSLFIVAIIYYLLLKENSRLAAVLGSLTYAVMPFAVFFSRTVLPDTSALSYIFIAIFFLYLHIHAKQTKFQVIFYILSLISFAASLLVKPTIIFYGLSLLLLFIRKYELAIIKKWHVYLYFLAAAIPLIVWRVYITQFPEGIPASGWLIRSVNTYEGMKDIFFTPAFFRWIFFERINNIIFGGYLTAFFILGTLYRKNSFFILSLLASAFAYLFTFQGGNVQHEYYQIFILPPLAMFVGIGINTIYKNKNVFVNPIVSTALIAGVYMLSMFFSYYRVKDYYNYSSDLLQLSKIINVLTKPDDKIVTDSTGDTTLLYLANRKGSPAVYKDLNDLKNDGYKYFATSNHEVREKIKAEQNFQVVFENDKYALFKL